MTFSKTFIILGSILVLTNAQTCTEEQSNAPCDANMPCDPTSDSVCDVTNGHCCPNSLFTTVAGATATTVFYSTATAATFATVRPISTNSTTCVDKVNPSTGVSDCPRRAALCNDSNYFNVMTDQCPKTCGRCSNNSTTTTGTCVDLVNPLTGTSDCPSVKNLCNDSNYVTLMRTQCPKTCGFCGSTSSSSSTTTASSRVSTVSGTCVDQVNPNTGTSDCPSNARLCTDSNYQTLMRTQCPKTCGFC